MKHLVVFDDQPTRMLLNGQLKYDLRFFKKKPEFLNKLSVGDVVYFRRKQREVLGQFEVGKKLVIEGIGKSDWEIVKQFAQGLRQEDFETKARENSLLIIIQIKKLEQFITSPIEIDKRRRKEWIVLEN